MTKKVLKEFAFLFLMGTAVFPFSALFLREVRMILVSVLYSLTFSFLMKTFTFKHYKVKYRFLAVFFTGFVIGVGGSIAIRLYSMLIHQFNHENDINLLLPHLAFIVILFGGIVAPLSGGLGVGLSLGRMETKNIFAIAFLIFLTTFLLQFGFVFIKLKILKALFISFSFAIGSGAMIFIALKQFKSQNRTAMIYGLLVGLSGFLCLLIIVLHYELLNEFNPPAILMFAAIACISILSGILAGIVISVNQMIGKWVKKKSGSALKTIQKPTTLLYKYIKPLSTFSSIYVLIALFFGFWYYALEKVLIPNSFIKNGIPMVEKEIIDFIYYSFVTITTLGYGDIVPINNIVRFLSIIEVIIGLAWLVVYFAFLVSSFKPEE